MSSFVLKIIACITMVCDHIRYVIPETNIPLTQVLGRMSYPLFAFLITEGYTHTKDLKKYYIRIIIFAIISQIPFMLYRKLVGDWKILNIMFTLLLGLVAINIYDKGKSFISSMLVIGIIVLGSVIKVDYRWWGVSVVVVFYIFRNNKFLSVITYWLVTFMYYYLQCGNRIVYNITLMRYLISSLIGPVIIILLYNGKPGKKIKYFFYWFYPIHMLVLYWMSRFFII